MRADRLLSLLMLLQARGRMTARQLASELEVSERTIYRDITALSSAGVPVYGDAGAQGGYALVDSYRTNLTGLTEGEVRALFMLSIPAPLADLGVSQELRAALLKLAAALPASRRGDEERVRQRFYLDSTWWQQGGEAVPHLQTIQRAAWQDLKLQITYQTFAATSLEQIVEPYGLVAKAGLWHLVCARKGRVRVHRVSSLLEVKMLDEHFEHPADFDLAAFWKSWCDEYESGFTNFRVVVRVAPGYLPYLGRYFGKSSMEAFSQAGPPDEKGWIRLEVSFSSFETARERILSLGGGIEVLEPLALRRSVLDFAEQIVSLYSN